MAPGVGKERFPGLETQPSFVAGRVWIDNAMLGCKNAVKFYRTSVVEYLFAERRYEMTDPFDKVVSCVKEKCNSLLASTKYTVGALPKKISGAGIYLFSQNGRPLYVGRTNNLRRRLQNHTHNNHNQATFAFLVARHETRNLKASYQPKGSRQDLLTNEDFRAAFDAARLKIKTMDVQFIEEIDPVKQTILEVLAALRTNARYNNFDNH